MRLRAIFCCLWYGLLPWQAYESTCHYEGMSYWAHAWMNLKQVFVWLLFLDEEEDRAFERRVNPTWRLFRHEPARAERVGSPFSLPEGAWSVRQEDQRAA